MLLRITPAGLTVTTPEGKQEYPNSGPFHFNANRAFISAVAARDDCHIRSSVGETLRSLALTLAANESARTGQVVNLDAYLQATRESVD